MDTANSATPHPSPATAQERQQIYIDLVVEKLKNRLGDRDVEVASLQAQLDMAHAESDALRRAIREQVAKDDEDPDTEQH